MLDIYNGLLHRLYRSHDIGLHFIVEIPSRNILPLEKPLPFQHTIRWIMCTLCFLAQKNPYTCRGRRRNRGRRTWGAPEMKPGGCIIWENSVSALWENVGALCLSEHSICVLCLRAYFVRESIQQVQYLWAFSRSIVSESSCWCSLAFAFALAPNSSLKSFICCVYNQVINNFHQTAANLECLPPIFQCLAAIFIWEWSDDIITLWHHLVTSPHLRWCWGHWWVRYTGVRQVEP